MNIEETIQKINEGREKVEASFVFSFYKDPDLIPEYENLEKDGKGFLVEKDSKFYFSLAQKMYANGFRNFDNISIESFLSNKPDTRKAFQERGGYQTVQDFKALIDPENVDAYYDEIVKRNMLIRHVLKTSDMFEHIDRFADATSNDVRDVFELLNTQIDLEESSAEAIETLTVDAKYIEDCKAGKDVGYSYHSTSPILNHVTLGVNPGLMMIGGQSGQGKSSFVFEVMILGLFASGYTTAIISNELGIEKYKNLLLVHILTHDLKYYGLTRKKIQIGKYTEEEEEKIQEALKIADEKYYGKIFFIKMFANNSTRVIKHLKRLKNNHNVSCVMLDTFKADDETPTNDSMWQELLMTSRKLFQTADKLGIGLITTYQLAPSMINQRYLDVSCLANAKQIKEVYSEVLFLREIWDSEMPEMKFDVKPYKWDKAEGSTKKVKKPIELEEGKKYMLVFVDKTRSDDNTARNLIYKWDSVWNKWTELGYCNVKNTNR